MVTYITRSQIGLRSPRSGPGNLTISRVQGVADHWPGMSKPINAVGDAGFRRVCSALRGWQDYHMNSRGWSDIAYQVAIDQEGRAYTLRGINTQSGANGNATANENFGAVLLVLGPGEQPSAKMIATARAVHADFRKRYPNCRVRPYGHQEVRQHTASGGVTTDCPGPAALTAIHAGKLDATTGATPPPTGSKPTVPSSPSKVQPVVDLSALVYHAKMGTGKYSPSNSGPMCEGVKRRLVALGCGSASSSFRTCYAAWQRKCGYTGSDADGIPGMTSLQKLAARSNWRVVA
jgi:hypothetical protein